LGQIGRGGGQRRAGGSRGRRGRGQHLALAPPARDSPPCCTRPAAPAAQVRIGRIAGRDRARCGGRNARLAKRFWPCHAP
jgi:hypothetical protein